jgi:anti-anti-sigma factor
MVAIMNINVKDQNNVFHVQLEGELDMGGIEEINKEMRPILVASKDLRGVIIDMEKLLFIESSGVAKLIATCKELDENSIPFYFVNVSPNVNEIFDLLAIPDILGNEHFQYSLEEVVVILNR